MELPGLVVILLELELLAVHVLVQAVDAHVLIVEKYLDKIPTHIAAGCFGLIGSIIRRSGEVGPYILTDTVADA